MSDSCSLTPISYKGDKTSRVSRVVYKIWRGTDDRQTDRRQMRRLKQKYTNSLLRKWVIPFMLAS